MQAVKPHRLLVVLAFLAATLGFAGGVWHFAAREALDRLAERGQADLRLAGDRLTAQLQGYRQTAVLMADHPAVVGLALRRGGDRAAASELLARVADTTGSLDLVLVDPGGQVLASAHEAAAWLPMTPDLQRAGHGALGFSHRVDLRSGRRIFSFAAPIFAPDGPVAGALILRLDVEELEAPGRGDAMPVWFSDALGVIFVTNRDEMRFRGFGAESKDVGAYYPAGIPLPPLEMQVTALAGHRVWTVEGGPYLPARALMLTRDLPVIEMSGTGLVDAGPALRYAGLQAVAAAALAVGFGAVLMALATRRRALATQLATEAEANAALEVRVADRTQALRAANDQLTRAQAELVQAGKLSALGQMSAGISHELNQPLMAIRSFAENAVLYLERGRLPEVGQNLERINELARRMGRIIKNLRAFARQESEPVSRVDLAAVVEASLDLMAGKLAQVGVTLHWSPPNAPVWVRGGEVRLQQVVVNLVSNAADAMEGRDLRALDITITRGPERVTLTLADTGPGIAEPERIFDPFYTTKEVGHSEGMGLGLSISYGLVQSFGGAITGQNRPAGAGVSGAVFTVDLAAAGVSDGDRTAPREGPPDAGLQIAADGHDDAQDDRLDRTGGERG
jgi:two-component system, NtrC family, C4-dicarboxylate transport sensor histidine kinase DctB